MTGRRSPADPESAPIAGPAGEPYIQLLSGLKTAGFLADLRSRVEQSLSGSYTLERELGGGGMSRVFVASEDRLGRRVVVKVLSTELAAAMSVPRFEREIRVAASLQQANIVPVLAAGDIDGIPYYTMPYVEGESLRVRLGRGPLAISEVLSILRDVARALAYAHERGVVHRDIKPDNVLLSGHTAVVTDFGIAKAIAAAAEAPTGATLTQLGTAIGTPAYMAPEQAAGDPATDHRADIYAFGCMAYELLAGQSPFGSLAPHKLLVAHMTETPKPVIELRPDCPPALASLVMQCLAKDPAARPTSATELLQRLDNTTSGAGSAMPAVLIGGRPLLWRALAIYVAAFIGVAIVARAAIIAIGLPDWVFPGALVVMALGLPVVLFTAYAQYVARRAAAATPTFTPGGTRSLAGHGTMATLAIKASPHVSWRRTIRGGLAAVGVFVLLIAGYMLLRALGIGPAGSLLASGKLSTSDKVLVAAFDAPGADSSLGTTIAEAVRTNLAESHAVHVMPTSAVVATLEQMQRPDTTRVTAATAREIAQRAGAKAVVAGSVVPAGTGYIVTGRLVAAETGNDLASFSESANDAAGLIPAVDRLTKALRRKIGESLKSVREAPPLDQVTTASLGALRSYAAGNYANDVQGDYPTAIQDYQDAIRQDSTFAMAHVELAFSLQTVGGPSRLAQANTELTKAFKLSDRLPERERYNVEGAYYMAAALDRRQAIVAFQRAVALDSSNADAANSLAVTLSKTRNIAAAVPMYQLALKDEPNNGTILANLALTYYLSGQDAAFDSIMAVFTKNRVSFPTMRLRYGALWAAGKYDSAASIARANIASANPSRAANAERDVAAVAALHGRLRDGQQQYAQADQTILRASGRLADPYGDVVTDAMLEGIVRGNPARGVSLLDSVLRAAPIGSVPASGGRIGQVAAEYAELGAPAKARAVLKADEATLDTLARRQDYVSLARARGMIAMADGKIDSAVANLRRGDSEADGLPTSNCRLCTPLFVGMAFDRGGEPDSARLYLTSYVTMRDGAHINMDPVFLGPTLLRLGQLYLQAGDTTRAIAYYGRFIDLWKNADPELQPRVAEARKAVAELVRAKG
jgi:tetratricopeptide (TPR) repeat protein/tRNA A-37 threonylcarbamoyl transferase component Bud32